MVNTLKGPLMKFLSPRRSAFLYNSTNDLGPRWGGRPNHARNRPFRSPDDADPRHGIARDDITLHEVQTGRLRFERSRLSG